LQLVVLLLPFCFSQHYFLPLRPRDDLRLRSFFLKSLYLGSSRLFEASINPSHCSDVFGRDAKVQQIDFVLTFCDVLDGDVFIAGCGLLSGAASSCGVVVAVVVSVVASPFFFAAMWCGVVCRTDGWAPNYWCRMLLEQTNTTTVKELGLKTVGINPVPFRTDFYILPPRFRIFGQIRNQYEIRDVKFENGSKTV